MSKMAPLAGLTTIGWRPPRESRVPAGADVQRAVWRTDAGEGREEPDGTIGRSNPPVTDHRMTIRPARMAATSSTLCRASRRTFVIISTKGTYALPHPATLRSQGLRQPSRQAELARAEQPAAASASFEEFYAATVGRLLGHLFLITGDLHAAEEIVQEAFTRASLRWSHLRDYDVPEAWVRRVAMNLAADRARSLRSPRCWACRTGRSRACLPEGGGRWRPCWGSRR